MTESVPGPVSPAAPEPPVPMSYEEYGVAFFEHAITEERVLAAVGGIAGQPIAFGPIGVGPGRLARISAQGAVGTPTATRLAQAPVQYLVHVPVGLDLRIDLQLDTPRFRAELEVPLVLTALAVRPLAVFVDVIPPRSRDISVDVRADGLSATVLRLVADVEGEMRRFVARYVAREVEKPHIRAARHIDVAAIIDRAYRGTTKA